MTHDEIRSLLPPYAAGVVEEADAEAVRRHLAGGCFDCLSEVFDRPVGLRAPAAEPPRPAPEAIAPASSAVRNRIVAAAVGFFCLALAGTLIWTVGDFADGRQARPERRSDQSARLRDVEHLQEELATRMRALEASLAAAENASRRASKAEATVGRLHRELDAVRHRVQVLSATVHRRAADLVAAPRGGTAEPDRVVSLAFGGPAASRATGFVGVRSGSCTGLRGSPLALCQAYCESRDCREDTSVACERLRSRLAQVTGTRVFPCDATTVSGTIRPCDRSHVDVWTFDVKRGQQYRVAADTVDTRTAADLCLVGSCPGSAPFSADDEGPCRFGHDLGCPRVAFVATEDATCTIAVTICSPSCTDSAAAGYELTVAPARSLTLAGTDVRTEVTASER